MATGPDPAVAAVRSAVGRSVAECPAGDLVLAAVSGGADSLALLAGLAWEAPRSGLLCGVVYVDHGLQSGARRQAETVAAQAKALGVTDVHWVSAHHTVAGEGREAAARAARYAAFENVAAETGASLVLTGHTRDDQAESVLLGLVRGSGGRSLAGIPPRRGRYVRPLLDLGREVTVAVCAAQGLTPWDDPSNADTTLLRNRIRHEVLPSLEAALGPGVAVALARTAVQLREDTQTLDELADLVGAQCSDASDTLACTALAELPTSLRRRVLRTWLLAAGVPGGGLAYVHLQSVDELVTRWRGQGPASLPGGLVALRRCDRLVIESA